MTESDTSVGKWLTVFSNNKHFNFDNYERQKHAANFSAKKFRLVDLHTILENLANDNFMQELQLNVAEAIRLISGIRSYLKVQHKGIKRPHLDDPPYDHTIDLFNDENKAWKEKAERLSFFYMIGGFKHCITAINAHYGATTAHGRVKTGDPNNWVQRQGQRSGTVIDVYSDYYSDRQFPFKAEVLKIEELVDFVILKAVSGDNFFPTETKDKIMLEKETPKNLNTFVYIGYDGGIKANSTKGRIFVAMENSRGRMLVQPAPNPGDSGAGAINKKGLVIGLCGAARKISCDYNKADGITSAGYGDVGYMVSARRIREALLSVMNEQHEKVPASDEDE